MAWLIAGLALAFVGAWTGSCRTDLEQPRPVVASSANALDAETCAECHNHIGRLFASAPHQLTLRRAEEDALWTRFAGRHHENSLGRFQFERRSERLWMHSDRHPERAPVDWIFGSGRHALTPVSVRHNLFGEVELNQLHVSWFHSGALGLTPGSEEVGTRTASLGITHTNRQTAECFGCHATYLPRGEQGIDLERMVPGVSCSRCHPGGQEHAGSDGVIPTQTAWQELTPLESIQRCGECHRRADQMTEDEIHVRHAVRLARFAPVGLMQSRCFTEPLLDAQGKLRRMDCLTCHDPHTPAQTDPDYYRERCIACHGPQTHQATVCRSQPMTSNCLPCHMPKVSSTEHLWFTDHWIRLPGEDQ